MPKCKVCPDDVNNELVLQEDDRGGKYWQCPHCLQYFMESGAQLKAMTGISSDDQLGGVELDLTGLSDGEGIVYNETDGQFEPSSAGIGDMTKAAYDTNDDGVVDGADDSALLDGSTKAQVQDHTPKSHASDHTDGTDDIQNATDSQKGLATSSQISKLDGIDSGADVTADNAPQAHQSSHNDGQTDALKLDDLATPDDNTDLDVSTSIHGLVPKGTDVGNFLRDDGTWATAPGAGSVDTSGTPVTNDYARFTDADTVEGRSYSEVKEDLDLEIGTDILAQQTIGIADDNLVEMDDADAENGDYAKFTANGLEGRSAAEVRGDLSVADGADVTGDNAPQSHASSHQSGGGDAVKLDDLSAPDDNTDLDVSISAHGLCPKGTNVGDFLKDDGTWATPAGGGQSGVCARAYLSGSNQSVGATSEEILELNAENYDEGSDFDTGTYKFTCPSAGKYYVHAQCRWSNMIQDKQYQINIYKNTDLQARMLNVSAGGNAINHQQVSDIIDCAQNDTLEIRVYNGDAGPIDVIKNSYYTFAIFRKME